VEPETPESKAGESSSNGKTEKVKAPAGASPQLNALYQQLNDLFQKIDNLKSSDASPEEIQKQVQILTNQVQALQAAIARIQQEEMEKNKSDQMVNLVVNRGDGINRPTEENAVDVYI
jgi:prefoldin subunit 5